MVETQAGMYENIRSDREQIFYGGGGSVGGI